MICYMYVRNVIVIHTNASHSLESINAKHTDKIPFNNVEIVTIISLFYKLIPRNHLQM